MTLLLKKILLAPLGFYRDYLSYYLPARCRFYPSCSSYAHEAIERHGPYAGLYLGVRRLLKCHPWHEGGVDLVPDKKTHKNSCAPCQSQLTKSPEEFL